MGAGWPASFWVLKCYDLKFRNSRLKLPFTLIINTLIRHYAHLDGDICTSITIEYIETTLITILVYKLN